MRRVVTSIVVLAMVSGVSLWAADNAPPAAPPAALPAPGPDGFIALFDGKDLTGWTNAAGRAPGAAWVAQDGTMTLDKTKGRGGDIWTQHRFGDFVLDVEFKTEGNSGIFVRTDKPTDNVQTGIEIQVFPPLPKADKHSCGAIYDLVAPCKEASKKGEWNHTIITCKGNLIAVEMNGDKIADMDLDKWTEAGKNPDGSKNKFRTALKDFKREGHIGLQDHGGKVAYRNIKIKPLN